MKKTLQMAAFLLPACIVFFGSRMSERNHFIRTQDDPIIEFPDEVKNIIDNKCYVCHNQESRSVMAKGKLMWDDLAALKKSSLVRKLDNIVEVLEDGSMPPSKYLKQNPDAQLTDEEVQLLKKWAENAANNIEINV